MNQRLASAAPRIIGLVASSFMIAVPAISQDVSGSQCPAGYWKYGSLCLNDTSGDVVNASRIASGVGCARGYWRYGRLCLSSETGDVEIADEQLHPQNQHAQPPGGNR